MGGVALGGGLQDQLGHMRFRTGRCCLVERDPGHHLFEDETHDLDEFGAEHWHDHLSALPSDSCGSPTIAVLTLTRHTQVREPSYGRVTLQLVPFESPRDSAP